MNRKHIVVAMGVLVVCMILLPKGWGQTNEERIKALEEAVKKLQKENSELKQMIAELKTEKGILSEEEVATLKKLEKGWAGKKIPPLEPFLDAYSQYTYRTKGDAAQPNDMNAFEIIQLNFGQLIHFKDNLIGVITLEAGIRDDEKRGIWIMMSCC